jgi:hypothetical protein
MFRFDARAADIERTLFPRDSSRTAQAPTNILTLYREDRIELLSGPRINIVADGNVIIRKNVPIRALMASSTKLHDLLNVKCLVTQFRVPRNVDRKSIERLLDLLTTGCIVDARTIKLTSRSFFADVLMYQACLALGIDYTHTIPLTRALRAEITARLLTFDEMNAIVECVPATDPLFKHLAHNLWYRRFNREISDILAFEKWLGRYHKRELRSAMIEMDQEREKWHNAHEVRQLAARKRIERPRGCYEETEEEEQESCA